MGMMRQLAGASAFFVLIAGAAHAEFAAEDLWAAWQEQATQSGVELTFESERVDDATLILSGVSAVLPGVGLPIALDELRLTSYDDDTVGIELGKAVFAKSGEGVEALTLELAHKGMEIIASQGADKLLSYELGAESVTLHYEQTSEGASWDPSAVGQPVVVKGAVTLVDVGGALLDSQDGLRKMSLALEAAKVMTEQTSNDPGMESQGSQTGVVDGMTLAGLLALPEGFDKLGDDTASFEKALTDGFAVELTLEQGAAQSSLTETGGMMPMEASFNVPGSSLQFVMNKDALSFGTKVDGETAIKVVTPMSEEAMDMTVGSFNLLAKMPSVSGDEPSDYAFNFALRDMVFSENVWAMFDPQQTLTRGAFTIDLDLSGKMKSYLDKAASAVGGDVSTVPEFLTLDVNTLLLQAAATALSGEGKLTFENIDGAPSPIGTLNFSLSHLSELLKALVGFGVIGEDDSTMVEAMIGGFAAPTNDPNVVTSEVEFKSGGSIFVNGSQVQ